MPKTKSKKKEIKLGIKKNCLCFSSGIKSEKNTGQCQSNFLLDVRVEEYVTNPSK